MPIVSDGKGGGPIDAPFEYSPEAAAPGYAQTSPGFADYLTSFNRASNPVASTLLPRAEESAYRQHDWFREMIAGNAAMYGSTVTADDLYQPSPKITAEEAHKKYAFEGQEKPLFTEPVEDELAKTVYQHKKEEIQAKSDVQRFESNNNILTTMGASTIASFMDPLNVAANIIPVVGEEAVLARLGLSGFGGRVVARGVSGAATMSAQEAVVAGVKAGLTPEGADYGIRDALKDVLWAAPSGALGTMVLGSALGEPLRFLTKREAPSSLKGTANRAEAASIASSDLDQNGAAVRTSIAQAMTGKPIDVADYFPSLKDHPVIEKLLGSVEPAELNLDRRAVARELEPKVMDEFTALEQKRADLAAQLGKMDATTAPEEHARLQGELQQADKAVQDMGAKIDPVLEQADKEIAKRQTTATADQFDNFLTRLNQFLRTDYTDMIAREKAWRDSGIAPGISHDELTQVIGDVQQAVQAVRPTMKPDERPPENWVQPAIAARQAEADAAAAAKAPAEAAGAVKVAEGTTAAPGETDASRLAAIAQKEGSISSSRIQQELGVGYPEASKLREQLTKDGIIDEAGKAIPGAPVKPEEPAPLDLKQAYPEIDEKNLLPEERDELIGAQRDVEHTTRMEDAYREAGLCLGEEGNADAS